MQRAQGSPLNRSWLCFKWVGGQVGGLPWPVSKFERFGAVLMGRHSCLRRLHRVIAGFLGCKGKKKLFYERAELCNQVKCFLYRQQGASCVQGLVGSELGT